MAGQMGQADQPVGVEDAGRYLGILDPFEADFDLFVILPDQAVGDMNRKAALLQAKPVLRGELDMIDGIGTLADIQCVRIREIGTAGPLPKPVNRFLQPSGFDIPGVSPLPEMDLQGDEGVFLDFSIQTEGKVKPLDLLGQLPGFFFAAPGN
jgi:hypothetical protein